MVAVSVALLALFTLGPLIIYCLWKQGKDGGDPRYVTIFPRKKPVEKS